MRSRVYGFAMVLTLVVSALLVACGEQATPVSVSPTVSAPPTSPVPSSTDTPVPPPASTVAPPTATTAPAATKPAPTEAPAPTEPPAAPTEPPAAPTGVMMEADPAGVVSIILKEDNGSGQSGWAALRAKGDQTEVMLFLPSGNLETELVHIHAGSCGADTLGGVEHGLTSFVDGSGFSVTTVDVPLSSLRTGDFAVNSHQKGEPGVYTSCGNIPTEAEALTIGLDAEKDSGQSGWATLTDRGDNTDVVLYITPGSLETELVHIHSGRCGVDTLGGVEHGLTSFIDGSGVSATTVNVPLSGLRTGDFAVNSHKKGEPGVYTSCGNIPAGQVETLSIILNEDNASGLTGSATLTAKGDQTLVLLSLSSGELETELVHIHSGRCGVDTLGGVEYGLTSFVDGSGFSVTTVDVPLSGLRTGDFAVNSHKKGEPGVYTSCGNIPAEAEALTIALDEENKSGQSGWATLTARSGKTDVVLYITPGSLATELVHIHSGQCGADTLGGVEHGLTSFVDGSGFSATTVDAPLSSLRTGDFAVNSHKKGEPGVYTSCGNISAGEATAAPLASALSVAIANFRFSPNSLEIKAGQKAQLMLTGDGRGHTFTVESLGVDVVVAAGATQNIEFEVPASASGTITFRCRYHSSGGTGMVGELKILGTSSPKDDSGGGY